MTKAKKIGIILALIGICLPTATLPFISEFKPVPELCLTSNFFNNMGNMVVVLGGGTLDAAVTKAGMMSASFAIPYRYLFSIGVVLVCTGLSIVVLATNKK